MGLTGITIGQGNRMVWEDDLFREGNFAAFGFTKVGFRKWVRALGVPMMRTPSGMRLIDIVSLQLALRAVNRIGQKDFLCPGCPELRKNRGKNFTTSLSVEYFKGHWKEFVSELLYAQRVNWGKVTEEHNAAFEAAAERISLALAQQYGEEVVRVQRRVKKQYNHVTDPPAYD